MATDHLTLTIESAPPVLRLALLGELDMASAPALIRFVEQLDLGSIDEVRIDCWGLTHVESAGITALLRLRAAADRTGAVVCLERVKPTQRSVLEIAELLELLHVDQHSG